MLVLAVGMLPFGLGSWNAARIIGVAAAVTFIILTIASAPSKAPNHNEQEQSNAE